MNTVHIADLELQQQPLAAVVYHKVLRLALNLAAVEDRAEALAAKLSSRCAGCSCLRVRCELQDDQYGCRLLICSAGDAAVLWREQITLPAMPDDELIMQQCRWLADASPQALLVLLQSRHDELQQQRNTLRQEEGSLALRLQRQHEDMQHQELHDTLTGLPNRKLLAERATQALQIARRQHFSCSLLVMGLNDFKHINDALGHHAGDLLLQEVARRFTLCLRSSDTLARVAGDEFAVLLLNNTIEQAQVVVEKLHGALKQPFEFEGHRLSMAVSIGIAEFLTHGDDIASLMRQADVAMHYAKKKKLDQVTYSPMQDKYSIERLGLLNELKHAIEADELELYYQPQICSRGEGMPSLEALVRWPHPEKGMVFPDQFIPLAEESGLIAPMTWWVMETAAAQCAAWHEQDMHVCMSINFSAQSLHDDEVVGRIADCVARFGLPENALTMEITESMLMADPQQASQVLLKIDALKVDVSIDDFGTGHSSLAYLKHLQVDELKIDRSFVMGMHEHHNDMVIVRTVINMAHNMGLRVVAEGVETEQCLHTLAELGCDRLQGYYISRPQPAETMTRWLQAFAKHGLQVAD